MENTAENTVMSSENEDDAHRAFAEYTSTRRRTTRVQNVNQPREVANKVDDDRDARLQAMFERLMAEMEEMRKKRQEDVAKIAALEQQLQQQQQQQGENAAAAAAAAEPKVVLKNRDEVCKDIVCYDEDDLDELANSIGNTVIVLGEDNAFRFADKCNFDIRQIIESVTTISTYCDVIMQSATQTHKSNGIAALAITAMKLGIPFFCFVLAEKSNVYDMCVKKMMKMLDAFGIQTRFLDNTKQLRKMCDDEVKLFKKGKLAIFAQGLHNNLTAATSFFQEHEVYNVDLVLDEADAFFSSAPHLERTRKEKELRKLTESESADEPLNAHIRCIHYVSATSDVIPFILNSHHRQHRPIIVDDHMLKERGYALPDTIKVLCDRNGRPQYLDLDKQTKKHSYNLYAPEINVMIDQIVQDMYDPDVTRCGCMLLVSLTRFINENDDGRIVNSDVVKYLIKMYRDKAKAKAIASGGHVRGNDVAIVGLVKRGGGGGCGTVDRYILTWDGAEPTSDTMMSLIDDVIHGINNQYTLDTPIFVSAYDSVVRNVSIRDQDRVITHSILSSTAGVNWANNNQRNTRYAGETVDVRKKNGFDYVTVLMQKEDADRHPFMYDKTAKCLVDHENMDEETAESIVQMAKIRPLASGKLGKFMEHNANVRLKHVRGNGDAAAAPSFIELEERRAQKTEDQKQRKQAFCKSVADDRDEAKAMEENDEIVDPGPGVDVSVPMAVRISQMLRATTGDVQVPAVYELETIEKAMTRATTAAFEHFQAKFGVTFPKAVVAKAKENEEAKFAYKFASKYDPTGASLCGRVLPDAYRIRSKSEMKCTAYVLYKMDGNPDVAGGSSHVPRTLQWRFVEDKDTKVVRAMYSVVAGGAANAADAPAGRVRNAVQVTDLTMVVPDQPGVANDVIRSAMQKLGFRSSTKRAELLLRFIMFNPGFIGTKGHFAQAIKKFNEKDFAASDWGTVNGEFDVFHSNTFERLAKYNIVTNNGTTYTTVAHAHWSI